MATRQIMFVIPNMNARAQRKQNFQREQAD